MSSKTLETRPDLVGIFMPAEAWAEIQGAIQTRIEALNPSTDPEAVFYLSQTLRQIDERVSHAS